MGKPLKIAVVGCGAVGSYYGARLAAGGHNVHFLLRSDYEAVLRHGVRVESPLGNFQVHPAAAKHPEEIGPSDFVLVALKTTANATLKSLLPPLVSPSTTVITLQNGLGNEEVLAQFVRPERIVGCLCFVCLNRIGPGVVLHLAHGQVIVADYLPSPQSSLDLVADTFRNAGLTCQVSPDLAKARWEKLIWNVPFNGLGVASAAGISAVRSGHADSGVLGPCLTTDKLLLLPEWEELVRQLMAEVILAARVQQLDLPFSLIEEKLDLTRCMGPYKPSTLLDFERRQPLEIESMFLEPTRRAKAAGAPVPTLEKLAKVLNDLDTRNRNGLKL